MDVRKSASSLDDIEWARYLNAIITLKHTFPAGSNVSIYDQFVAVHWGVYNFTGAQTRNGAHGGPAFFPWHREYLKRYEQALQSVDARVTLPYWNWGNGEDEAEIEAIFRDDRMGPMGSGNQFLGTVTSGYFALNANDFNPNGWRVRPEIRQNAYATEALYRRTEFPDPDATNWPTSEVVGNLMGQNDFHQFRPGLEGPHGTVHMQIGGDMGQRTSPNDPIFFMHHAQIDRIWAHWQRSHPGSTYYNPSNLSGPGHEVDTVMWPWDGGASITAIPQVVNYLNRLPDTDLVRPLDVLNHRDLGYCYDDEPNCPCPTRPLWPRRRDRDWWRFPTTLRFGEDFDPPTTLLRGEEIDPPTTLMIGEEIDPPTTLALGEEFPPGTTQLIGEEEMGGVPTDPRVDDPLPMQPMLRAGRNRFTISPFGKF